uniref:Suppressor of SWI4 1 homolog n=1 Tax=Phallusia mammillata TaxID=59560 RepID=A0A6F9DPZ2_9ASCI|nr:suppressor of SWI4 1 homolog [Phallusia mammillata]
MQKAPHTFVFSKDHVGTNVQQLTSDFRKLMEPYTASNLKIRKTNTLKDFVAVSSPLGVTHMIMFTKSLSGINMKISRLPQGPTVHFKVLKYSLNRDVNLIQARPKASQGQFKSPPLLVLSNFLQSEANTSKSGKCEVKLCSTLLQNMLPSLNINRLSAGMVQRCLLFSYNANSKHIEVRHYNVATKPSNVSRHMDDLLSKRQSVPDLSPLADISDLLMSQTKEKVQINDGSVWTSASPSAMVGLTEIGPRMTLQIYKVESGLCQGEVIYHSFRTKTLEERHATEKKVKARHTLKQNRRLQQEKRVQEKRKKMYKK